MPIDFYCSQKGEKSLSIYIWKWDEALILNMFQINELLQAALNQDDFIDDALILVAGHNKCIEYTKKFNFGGAAQICSISYTTIFLPPSRIDVKDILQVNKSKTNIN